MRSALSPAIALAILASSELAVPANLAEPVANWMRLMEPDLTRASPLGSAVIWRGFLGVRLTVVRGEGGAGFRTRGDVDAITGGGGGGGTAIFDVSGGGNGAIIGGGGGGATGMGARAVGICGGAGILDLRGVIRFFFGAGRRAVLTVLRGAGGIAMFFRGALRTRCLAGLGGVSTIRGAGEDPLSPRTTGNRGCTL